MMVNTKRITATGSVYAVAGQCSGFVVNSHTNGTLKLEDSVGGGQNLLFNTITFPAGPYVMIFPTPIKFDNGLYATVGGTADITFFN